MSSITNNNSSCAVCSLSVERTSPEARETLCNHLFHRICLKEWVDIYGSCKVCEKPLYGRMTQYSPLPQSTYLRRLSSPAELGGCTASEDSEDELESAIKKDDLLVINRLIQQRKANHFDQWIPTLLTKLQKGKEQWAHPFFTLIEKNIVDPTLFAQKIEQLPYSKRSALVRAVYNLLIEKGYY